MAIAKTMTDDKGQVTAYHRITSYTLAFMGETPTLDVSLADYTSEEYRNVEKEDWTKNTQVKFSRFFLPIREDDTYTRSALYEAVMALPEFKDSQIV